MGPGSAPETNPPGGRSDALNKSETLHSVIPVELEDELRRLLTKASEREIMLGTAESCTGGMVASLLTDVPGVSHAFDRGFVTYTNEAKHEMLGVPMTLLDTVGAVSKEVAIAMAEGGLTNSRANILFAVTGYADSGDEPGLVHFACARAGRRTVHREEHFGDIGRGPVRIECLRVGVEMMTEML
jgi:nicotinamide-nucleotide amidase